MRKGQAKKRIEKLREVINRQRYLYHALDKQDISDEAHDSLKHELWQLEQQFPDLVTPDSPTQRVGGEPLEKFEKVEHRTRMLSMEDVFSEEELRAWEEYMQRLSGAKNISYFSELKIDGFAVTLAYRNGVFEVGATRGNGQIGENVTQNLKTIESIPLRLEIKEKLPRHIRKNLETALERGRVEVRGEVYMEKEAFEQFNKKRQKEDQEPFANPRNLAAGSIRQLDPKLAASRPLQFIAYDLVHPWGGQGEREMKTHAQEHEILKVMGFKTDSTAKVCKNLDEVLRYWQDMQKKRDSLPFQVDGIVVQVNDRALLEELGVAGKGHRGMRALKFAGKQATTKILDIQVQVGRTGAITPVAMLEPVQVAGVTISRATLHNEDEIQRLRVMIGDTVVVERAGDVIPAVAQVVEDLRSGSEKAFHMPTRCPLCEGALIKPKGEAVTRCINKNCQARQRESVQHFVSRKAFDIEGLGPKIVEQLQERGLIRDAADLFELKEGDLAPLERFADRSASNLVRAIKGRKQITFSRFLYALGIRHVGEETAIGLADHFLNIADLRKATKEELEQIQDVGSVVAKSIVGWFGAKENLEFLKRLRKVGVRIQDTKYEIQDARLAGKTFALTGSLESMSRDEAKSKIRECGGTVSESVSQKTDYVVSGEKPGLKFERAKKLGVRALTEEEFLAMLRS